MFSLSLVVVAGVATGLALRGISRPAPRALISFDITPPATASVTTDTVGVVALSHDGRTLVYAGSDNVQRRLYARRFDQIDVLPLAGTEGTGYPFFSPDSQWVGFGTAGELKKVRLDGGPPVTVSKLSSDFRGGSWGANNIILFATAQSGLWQVGAVGGEAKPVTTLEAGELEHRTPELLPGGQAAIFTIMFAARDASPQLGVVPLGETGQRRGLLGSICGTTPCLNPRYASTGHIVFGRMTGEVWAVPFDLGRLDATGEPVPVVEGVAAAAAGGIFPAEQFSMSADGTLVYLPSVDADLEQTLVLVDRKGQATPVTETKGHYLFPRLSPDGRRVAVGMSRAVGGPGSIFAGDIWICDVTRQTCSRLTSRGGTYPVWTPDGSRVASSRRIDLVLAPTIWTSIGSGRTEAGIPSHS